jgi:hypothetical protein
MAGERPWCVRDEVGAFHSTETLLRVRVKNCDDEQIPSDNRHKPEVDESQQTLTVPQQRGGGQQACNYLGADQPGKRSASKKLCDEKVSLLGSQIQAYHRGQHVQDVEAHKDGQDLPHLAGRYA